MKLVNALSVDVEDYFQVSAFERHIAREQWDSLPRRVESNTDQLLALFAEHNARATFFVLGWVAQRHPGLVRRIIDGGHELASHGYSHTRVCFQSPEQFRHDVSDAKKILEDIAGAPVKGYRAPTYSINRNSLWAFDMLEKAGYRYSSSVYPIHHDLYGMPEAPRFPFRPTRGDLVEIPITTVRVLGRNIPCGGGGYFRLLPYAVSRAAMQRVNVSDGKPCVFYFHPWEVDPGQPRQTGISLRTRFRHYVNLGRMESRLRRLLQDFSWDRIDNVFVYGTVGISEFPLSERYLQSTLTPRVSQ
jgi:polysaccharide deacetylase family protein (PEP-CTERM system associated)